MRTTTIRARRHGTRTLLTALAAAAIMLVAIPVASAAPAATSVATGGCWLAVINDWLDNNRVDRTYPVPCYTQAIQHLNAYPDVQNYSSATDDIQRALLAAIRQDRGSGPGAGSGPTTGGPDSSGGAAPGGSSGGGGSPPGGGSNGGLIGSFSPSSAQSVPLPLLVLGGLALLLLLSAGGTLLARRLQARRIGPPAPAVDKRG
jgi:uncharacterized membrane protein YgcG